MVNARDDVQEPTKPNWWILGGSLAFVLFTLTVGFGDFLYSEEIVFAGSMSIVVFLMAGWYESWSLTSDSRWLGQRSWSLSSEQSQGLGQGRRGG
jgi:hypothetical protein